MLDVAETPTMSAHGAEPAAERFSAFFESSYYRQWKNLLFNYRLRKRKAGRAIAGLRAPILDIGSGISPLVSDNVTAILGDTALTAMQVARSQTHTTAVLDVTALGVRSGSVNAVVCSEVLEHLADDQAALREIARVLRPAGEVVLTVPLHAYLWHRDDDMVGHYRRYNPSAFHEVLRATGLEVVATDFIGSLLERYLTLTAAVVFLRANGKPRVFSGLSMLLFGAANWLIVQLLVVAALFTPRSLSSLELVRCCKLPPA
jgi:SAM-dependent methyltransferase